MNTIKKRGNMMKKSKIFIILITLLAAGIIIFAVLGSKTETRDLTEKAIDFTLTDQYGEQHTLSDYKGKVVFVNFWATWCPPCRNELPSFQKIYEEYGKNKKDVVILGVYAPDFDKEGSAKDVMAYFKEQGFSFPILADKDAKVFIDYAISGLPTTVMVDKKGKEVGRNTGKMNTTLLKKMITNVSER